VRYLLVALAVAVAVLVGWLAQRRRPSAPLRTGYGVPEQLDRADFDRPDAPWLVAVFTSATCGTCQDVMTKAVVVASHEVAVHEVEYGRDRRLHDRYDIDAVPAVLIADADGVVRKSFLGPTSATHLWAALAEVRDPGAPTAGCPDH
jgi:hypothetical protein